MANKYLWLLALGMIGVGSTNAQQDPSFTHFTYNKLMYNPAYAGASGNFCLNAISHQQWLGYEDQTSLLKTQGGLPVSDNLAQNIGAKTNGAAFTAPISIKIGENKVNIGGVFMNFMKDRVAYEDNTFLRGGLSGAYTMADGSNIRLGFEITSLTKMLDGKGLRAHDPSDPNIPTSNSGETKLTFGSGIYYSNPNVLDGIWGGVSMTHMAPQTFAYGTSGTIKITTARHLYIVGGAKMEQFLSNPSWTFEPAFMLKSAMGENGGFVKPELDLQGMMTFDNLYAAGLNLRSYGFGMDAASIMLGYYPPIPGANAPGSRQTLRVGYSYDLTLSNVRRTSWGTHELQVNYCFNFELPTRPPKVYRHPRWMMRNPNMD